MFTIILVDFGLDIAFIIVHGHDLKWLYPATYVDFFFLIITKVVQVINQILFPFLISVVILSFPILINLISTFMIVTRELKVSKSSDNNRTVPGSRENDKNLEFRQWWFNNSKTALFFVLFSSIDIEGLNILSSGYSGYERFNAPISDESAKIILIINGVVKFLEDIPQFIIYVSVDFE